MSRRRHQRRAEKAHRHAQPLPPLNDRAAKPEVPLPSRVIVREARFIERLAYTRSQAAEALGISRSTLRRLLPYIDTIEMPWGSRLIPVDELERLAAERRRLAQPRLVAATRGRKLAVPPEIVRRIHRERLAGKSLRQIADDLNTSHVPTAHGGERWWPSTVRGILRRSS